MRGGETEAKQPIIPAYGIVYRYCLPVYTRRRREKKINNTAGVIIFCLLNFTKNFFTGDIGNHVERLDCSGGL